MKSGCPALPCPAVAVPRLSLSSTGKVVVRLLAYEVGSFEEPRFLKDHDLVDWLLPHQLAELQLAPADVPIAEKLARAFKDRRA